MRAFSNGKKSFGRAILKIFTMIIKTEKTWRWYKQKSPTNRDVFILNWRINFKKFCAVLIESTLFHLGFVLFFGN